MKSQSETTVFVGVGKVWLEIPNCRSLKEKRGAIRPLVAHLREKFGVAVAEIGHHDLWGSSVLGFCVLGNSRKEVERYLGTVMDGVLKNRDCKVVDYVTEVISAGGVERCHDLDLSGDDYIKSLEEMWLKGEEGN